MTQAIMFIIGLVVGMFLIWLFLEKRGNKKEEIISEKEKGKEQIMNLLEKNGRITNDEVEKLLSVSNTTAYRYLEELEQEEKIAQVGKTGRSVYYKKTKN